MRSSLIPEALSTMPTSPWKSGPSRARKRDTSLENDATKQGREPFKVSSCSDYNDTRVPSKADMEEIACIIRTKAVNRQVGFANDAEPETRGGRT